MSDTPQSLPLDIASGNFINRLALKTEFEAKAKQLEIDTIATDDDLSLAASKVKRAKELIKMVETARKDYTSQLDALKKQLMAQEAEIVAPLKNVVLMYNHLSAVYAEHKHQQRLEAERAAAEAAAEAQRKMEQAKAAAALGVDTEKAAAEAAEAAEKAANALSPEQLSALSPVANVAMRVKWDFRITDAYAVPREFLEVNTHAIRERLQSLKRQGIPLAQVAIPGIEVFETATAVAR